MFERKAVISAAGGGTQEKTINYQETEIPTIIKLEVGRDAGFTGPSGAVFFLSESGARNEEINREFFSSPTRSRQTKLAQLKKPGI